MLSSARPWDVNEIKMTAAAVVGCVMDRHLQYYPFVGLNGRIVYIFKLASGSLQTAREAEEIAEKAKSNLKAGDYAPDIVVMEGEPSDNPKLFGSYSCVRYIRSVLLTIPKDVWHPATLD